MIPSAEYELKTLAVSVAAGALSILIYDLFRAVCPPKKRGIVFDVLLWIAEIAAALFAWEKNRVGALRGYMPLGYAAGAVLYRFTAEPLIFLLICTGVKKICKFFNIISKILLTAGRFFGKILLCTRRICGNIIKKVD